MNSCNNNEVYSGEKKIKGNFWLYSDPLTGTFQISDTSISYDVLFELTHQNDYSFQNLYLRITDDFTGKLISDTVNINLADEYGVWIGKGISENKKLSIPLRKAIKFKKLATYNYKIEQFSRSDTLRGISKIALVVRKAS
jgi:gliding motility-associated lipoprotein GldH